mmetsp:Transcript_35742/g.81681  ORF Transcript_35742/g.81681 Transcript_35742/m.81681 type:complete len:311 (+) Transcript_35742:203-1135(+)
MATTLLLNLPGRLVDVAFDEHATREDLLLLVAAIAIFWSAVFCILHAVLRPWAQQQDWLKESLGREYDRVGMTMCTALGVNWTRDRYISIMLNDWPKMQGIYLQHFVGGALCLPAVLGYSESWAVSLACLGILSEIGWELSDVADILITRTCQVDGKERCPNTMLGIMMLHHSMSLTLGLPCVLKYRTLRELHLMTFNLQWAAAIAISMNEYTKTLNLSNPTEQLKFRILNLIGFLIMAWMRGFEWFRLSLKLMTVLHDDNEWSMLAVGSVVIVLMSAFNLILCIYPFARKMTKDINFGSSFGGKKKDLL